MIEFHCPHCDRAIRVSKKAAGKTGTCQTCGESIKVPGRADLAKVDPVIMTNRSRLDEPVAPVITPATSVAVQVNTPRSSGAAHSLGVGAVILGIVAFLVCWIPLVNVISLPLAGIGLLLAIIGGIAALFRRGRGLGYPIAGGTFCVMAIGVALFVNIAVGNAIVAVDEALQESQATRQTAVTPPVENETAEAPTPTPTKRDEKDDWADGFAGVTQGDVLVRVESIATDFVDLEDFSGAGQSEERLLQVKLRIENKSQTKKLDYRGWSGGNLSLFDGAQLEDNLGNSYRPIWFAQDVVGQVKGESIYPGKGIADLLVFEPPIERAEWLKLTLPASAIDGEGMLRLKLLLSK